MTTREAGAHGFAELAKRQLRNERLPLVIGSASDRREIGRREFFAGHDLEELRRAAEAVRAHTMANLDRYLDRFATNAEANGMRVHFAATAGEAVAAVREIVRSAGAKLVAKGKSMVSEEIELNPALERDGVEVVETDLGEYIVQLAGQPPAHITAPAIHMSRTDVANLFTERHGRALPDDPGVLTDFARGVLRETFLRATVGISGVNFAIADTGSFVIVTNEGNGRMVSSLPNVHIALMGMERVVPSHRELGLLLPLLVGSAISRPVTTYFSFVNGPRRPGEDDGPREVHVVILDNGRSHILGTEYRSILHCIRCGACQNVCPVFRQVGGHGYGAVYGGPIGAVLTPLLEGFDRAGDLPHASSLCGACTEVCPVNIPLHEHLIALRRDVARDRRPLVERAVFRAWSSAWRRPSVYRALSRVSAVGHRLLLAAMPRRVHLPLLSRWTATRDLPRAPRATFRRRWRRRSR